MLGADAPAHLPAGSLAEGLHAWTAHLECDLLVILDQFEEYFLYHGQEDGPGTFAVEFPAAVNRRDLRASFLVSLREDAVAKLDRFKGRIPSLFDNYLRVEHLGREAARAAIEKPLQRFNQLHGGDEVRIEGELVEAALEQLRTGRFALAETGRGGVGGAPEESADDTRIETPFLQLVMTRLWEKEAQAGSRVLRRASLEELGGADRIVRTHLDKVMEGLSPADQDAASRIFHHLVTPGGTKIAHTPSDLADYTDLPAAQVERVLEALARGETRVLRSDAPRYEIFHDVLAPAVLDWRRRHLERRRQAEVGRQARRRSVLLSGGLVVLLVAVGITALTLHRHNQKLSHSLSEAEVVLEDQAYVDSAAAARTKTVSTGPGAPLTTPQGSGLIVTSDTLGPPPPPPPPPPQPYPQVASAPADRARRRAVVVRYYQPPALPPTGVVDTLRALGFGVEEAEGRFDAHPNSIAYGSRVPAADVEALALAMTRAGLLVKRIHPLRAGRGRGNVIEVVHSTSLVDFPYLTVDQIRTHAAGGRKSGA